MSDKERLSWEEREDLHDEMAKQHRAHLEAMRCEICGEAGQRRILWGGRSASLCNAHTNTWSEHATEWDIWRKRIELGAKYAIATQAQNEAVAIEIKAQIEKLAERAYVLSGEWLKEEKMKWGA